MSSLKIKNNGVWETITTIEGKQGIQGPSAVAIDTIEPVNTDIKIWLDPNGDALDGIDASSISVVDTGAYYTSNNVESILQEVGEKVASGGGQLLGTAAVKAISYNAQNISENITIPGTVNAMSVGPIVISEGFTVVVEDGATWVII